MKSSTQRELEPSGCPATIAFRDLGWLMQPSLIFPTILWLFLQTTNRWFAIYGTKKRGGMSFPFGDLKKQSGIP